MIISRALGPTGVGQITIFRQTVILIAQLASLGLPMAMIRLINSGTILPIAALNIFFHTGLLLSFLAACVLFVLLWINPAGLYPSPTSAVVIGGMFWVVTLMARTVLYNFSAAMLWIKVLAALSIVPAGVLAFIYAVLWYFSDELDVNGITVVSAILIEAATMGGFSLLIAWALTRSKIKRLRQPAEPMPNLRLRVAVSNLPFGLQLMTTDILVIVTGYLTLILLSVLSGDMAEVGYYTRGVRLATIGSLAVQSLQRLLYANWTKLDPERRVRSVENTVNFSLQFLAPVVVLIFLGARPFTVVLFGSDFIPAVPVTRVVLLGVCLQVVGQIFQSLFNSVGSAKFNNLILAINLVIALGGTCLLAPTFGATGTAIATVAGNAAMTLMAVHLGRAYCGIRIRRAIIPRFSLLLQPLRTFRR
jgi:O-antigen/teichoic acid export membrane protein